MATIKHESSEKVEKKEDESPQVELTPAELSLKASEEFYAKQLKEDEQAGRVHVYTDNPEHNNPTVPVGSKVDIHLTGDQIGYRDEKNV